MKSVPRAFQRCLTRSETPTGRLFQHFARLLDHHDRSQSHDIAFAQFFAESLLTLAEGPPRTLREHGVVQLTERYWRLGDGDVVFENAEGYVDRRGSPVGSANAGMPREVEMSLKCPNGHIFWHERANYSNGKTTSATATTIQVGISKSARKRIDGDSYVFCEKCKLGNSNWGGSKVTVHFSQDGTCRCKWRDGSFTDGRWHDSRSETAEERDSLCCELCEELL
jgi:hypothetical protein